jgi:hypothetical protein
MRYLSILLIAFLVSTKVHAQSDWHDEMNQWYYEQQQIREQEYRDKWQWKPAPEYSVPSLGPDLLPSPFDSPQHIEVNVNVQPQEDYLGQLRRQSEFQQQQWNSTFQNGVELGAHQTFSSPSKPSYSTPSYSTPGYSPPNYLTSNKSASATPSNLRSDEVEVRLADGSSYVTSREIAESMHLPIIGYGQLKPGEVEVLLADGSHSVTSKTIATNLNLQILRYAPEEQSNAASVTTNQRVSDHSLQEPTKGYQSKIYGGTLNEPLSSTQIDTVTGFLGIPWGSSYDLVKKAILNRHDGAQYGGKKSDTMWFHRGRFGDFTCKDLRLEFVDNLFWKADIDFNIDTSSNSAITIYESLKKAITNKHGNPDTTGSDWVVRTATWALPQTSIDLEDMLQVEVMVSYHSVKLLHRWSEKYKSSGKKADY